MPATDLDPQRWRRDGDVLCYSHRRPGQFQKVALGWCLAWPHDKTLSSGEVDYDGHISRRGDTHVRSLLYEAATMILTRSTAESTLRTWGLALRERVGFKRAAVAVARKLAVTMHAMLRSGEIVRPHGRGCRLI